MAFTPPNLADNVKTTLAVQHASGGATLVVNPPARSFPAAPFRVTCYASDTAVVVYLCTAISGNTLTVAPDSGYSDQTFAAGTAVGVRATRNTFADIATAINTIALTPGPQGSTGSQGSPGSQGTGGSAGSAGPQGAQGSQGVTGSQGVQGSAGPQGFQGSTGSQGSQGNQGSAGGAGPQGSTGSQGNQGSAGGAGPQGSAGPQGAQGGSGSSSLALTSAADLATHGAGLGGGGGFYTAFRRTLPPSSYALDLGGVNLSSHDPRPYYENNFDGAGNNYLVLYDRIIGSAYGNGILTIGWAKGPTIDQLTDQGVWIDPATVNSQTPSAAAATLYKDGSGTYHMILGAVDTWATTPSRGQTYRLTSTTLTPPSTTPWTLAETVFADGGAGSVTNRGLDPSAIVYWNGAYRFLFIRYNGASGQTRSAVMASTTSLSSPSWTFADLSNLGGSAIANAGIDSPTLWTLGGRLMGTFYAAQAKVPIYDHSKAPAGYSHYLGSCFAQTSYEGAGTSTDWGITGVCQRPDGTVEALAQDGSPHSRMIPARLTGVSVVVDWNPNTFWGAGSGLSGSGIRTVTIVPGIQVPEGTVSVYICLLAVESGTYTQGETVTCDLGTTYGNLVQVPILAAGGSIWRGVGWIPLDPGSGSFYVNYSGASNMLINYSINQVQTLGE